MLIISIHDTLRSLGIYFRLFANSVHDTKYHKQRSLAHYLRSWNSNTLDVCAHYNVYYAMVNPLILRLIISTSSQKLGCNSLSLFFQCVLFIHYTKYSIQCLIVFSVVTTLPCSTLIFNSLTISARRYARRCVEILLLSMLFQFPISLSTLDLDM